MPFNPSPKVAAARDIAQKFGKRAVIVLMIAEDKEGTPGDETGLTLEYASYGVTRAECDAARALAEEAYSAVEDALNNGLGVEAINLALYAATLRA